MVDRKEKHCKLCLSSNSVKGPGLIFRNTTGIGIMKWEVPVVSTVDELLLEVVPQYSMFPPS